jgi:type 1 glutamine amidotransferase
MVELARSTGEFAVSPTEDLSRISTSGLADFDVVFFALTSGELALDNARKTALLEFVTAGGGFMGAHSATDTLYEWPEYGALVGAYFKEHPWTTTATVRVEDEQHEATTGLGDRFSILEEFYTFRENPRASVHVLLSLDPASVGAAGDFPLAWTRQQGQGRVYYNALGHFPDTWRDPRFQNQLTGAVRWVADGLSGRLARPPVTHLLTPPAMPARDPGGWPSAR